MRKENNLRALVGLAAAALLSACGGGGGDDAGAGIPALPTVLAQLNTSAGLTDPAVARAYDESYLDAGQNKSQVLDALTRDADNLSADPSYSLFPQVALTDTALTDCDAQNVCTLTGTLHNTDADETTVPFSTKVVRVGSAYRLLGDQAAS